MRNMLGRAVAMTMGILLGGAFPACSCSHPPGIKDMSAVVDLSASSFDIAPPTPSSDGGCSPGGAVCGSDSACCSGRCDPIAHLCTLGACGQSGAACKQATDCCNLNCTNGTCGSGQCTSDDQACSA